MKKFLIILGAVIAIGVIAVFTVLMRVASPTVEPEPTPVVNVTNFLECVAAGNPVMESYPRQCRHGNQSFTEDIGNEFDKADLIRISSPRPNQVIVSPLLITGEARGNWFFEASFPVALTDWDGRIIAEGVATAKNDWMTEDFVPFEASLTFTPDPNAYSNNGTLILRKDNPSGLPENDDALEVPVVFGEADPAGDGAGILPFDSGVFGTVLRGPVCPVERNPPEPGCEDQPFETTVQVIAKGSPSSSSFATAATDKDGRYTVALPPGEYALQPVGRQPFPRCETVDITVEPGVMNQVDLSCDTGIR
jgi:hypothetical protein